LIFTRNLEDGQRVYNAPRTSDDVGIVYVADLDGNIPAELDFAVQPSTQCFCLFIIYDYVPKIN